MNDDLLISIGADTSSFSAAVDRAKQQFKSLETLVGAKGTKGIALKFRTNAVAFSKELKQIETKAKMMADKVKADINASFSGKLSTEELDRYYKEYLSTVTAEEKKATEIKVEQAREAEEQKQRIYTAAVQKRYRALKRATRARIAEEERVTTAYNLEVQKRLRGMQRAGKVRIEAEDRLKRIKDYLHIRRLRQIRAERTATKEALSQQQKAWALQQQQAISQGRASAIGGGKPDGTASWDFAGHRGLIDSAKVVAKYGAISQALYGIQSAYRAVGAEIVRFDQSVYNNMAVLGASEEQAKALSKTADLLSQQYGGSAGDIADAMLTLGRAGLEIDKGIEPLQQATKVLTELALITGDTMADGAAGIATMVSVYPELTNEVAKLGNQMGIVANATRLGLKDFTTISNYALTTAKSIGLSSEAYLALAGSMSKVGLNASTIGTSIRRLKKFTDSTAESMKTFFRYLGISQKEFTSLLQSEESSTAALIAFAKQLDKVSQDKAKYTKMTKNLNIQEKATIDALRLIGKSNYFSKLLIDLRTATDESKQLEKQAQRMAQGLTKAFERTGNIITQAFNGLGETISSMLFDNTSVESFNNSIDNLAKTVLFLIKQIPILTAAWIVYSIRMSIVNKAHLATMTSMQFIVARTKALGAALKGFAAANWPILLITAAFTAWNIATTATIEIHKDLNQLMKEGAGAIEEYGEAQLVIINRDTKQLIQDTKDEIEAKQKLLKIEKERYAAGSTSDWFGIVDRGETIENYTAQLEGMNKKLLAAEKLLKDINEQQTKYSDTPLAYELTGKDVANLREVEILSKSYGENISSALLSYGKLVAKKEASVALTNEELVKVDNEKKIIDAIQKQSLADYNLQIAKKRITDKLTQGRISSLASEGALKALQDKGLASAIKIESLEKQRGILLQKQVAIDDAIKANLKEKGDEYKKSTEYAIELTEQNKNQEELNKNQLETKKEQNAESERSNSLAVTALAHASKLITAYQTIADKLAEAANSMNVLSGGMTIEQASVVSAQTQISSANIGVGEAEKAVTLAWEQLKAETDTVEMKNKQKALDEATLELTNRVVDVRQKEVALAQLGSSLNLQLLKHSQDMTAEGIKQNRITAEGLTGKAKAVRDAKWALEDAVKARKDAQLTDQASNSTLNTKLSLEQAITAESKARQKLADAEARTDSTGAANKRAGLKLITDEIALLGKKAELAMAELENNFARKGLVASEYEMNNALTTLYEVQAKEAKDAYDTAVKKFGLTNKEATVQKKILDLQIKATKADTKAWKQKNKELTKFQKAMQSAGGSFADNLLEGDIAGAFKDLFNDIVDVFVQPLKDSFADLFGSTMTDLFGTFYASMTESVSKWAATAIAENTMVGQVLAAIGVMEQAKGDPYSAWVRMAAMAATMAALGFAVSAIGGGSGASEFNQEDWNEANNITNSPESESAVKLLESMDWSLTRDLTYSKGIYDNISLLVAQSDKAAVAISGGFNFDAVSQQEVGGFAGFSTSNLQSIYQGLYLQLNNIGSLTTGIVETFREESSSWWGLSNEWKEWSTVTSLTADQFNPIAEAYGAGVRAIGGAATALGVDNAYAIMQGFNGEMHKLNFEGKSQDEIAAMINGAISSDLDQLAEMVLPWVGKFAEVGEDFFETVGRLVYEMELIDLSFTQLGSSLSITGEQAVAVTQAFIDASGGLDNALSNVNGYIDTFYTDAEKQALRVAQLEGSTGLFDTAQDYKDEVARMTAQAADGNIYATNYLAELLRNTEAYAGYFEYTGTMIEEAIEDILTTLTDAALFTQYVSAQTGFEARNIALQDDPLLSGEYAITAAEMMLDAITAQTELQGLTMANYQDQFTAAHLAGELTADQLSNWEAMGDAILNVEEAQESYTDALIAEQERLAEEGTRLAEERLAEQERIAEEERQLLDERAKAQEELLKSLTDGIKAVRDAWIGNLSYLTLAQKAEYASGYLALANESDGTIDTVDAARVAAETALKTTATKEEYIPIFERYINELEGQIPEATTDDVVNKLDELIIAVRDMDDNIVRTA